MGENEVHRQNMEKLPCWREKREMNSVLKAREVFLEKKPAFLNGNKNHSLSEGK